MSFLFAAAAAAGGGGGGVVVVVVDPPCVFARSTPGAEQSYQPFVWAHDPIQLGDGHSCAPGT